MGQRLFKDALLLFKRSAFKCYVVRPKLGNNPLAPGNKGRNWLVLLGFLEILWKISDFAGRMYVCKASATACTTSKAFAKAVVVHGTMDVSLLSPVLFSPRGKNKPANLGVTRA